MAHLSTAKWKYLQPVFSQIATPWCIDPLPIDKLKKTYDLGPYSSLIRGKIFVRLFSSHSSIAKEKHRTHAEIRDELYYKEDKDMSEGQSYVLASEEAAVKLCSKPCELQPIIAGLQ